MIKIEDEKLADVLTLALTTSYRIRLLPTKTNDEALELIKKEKGVDCVIFDRYQASSSFFEFVREKYPKLPCLFCEPLPEGDPPPEINIAGAFDPKTAVAEIPKALIELFGDHALIHDEYRDYCPIQTELLLRIGQIECDIFIQLSPEKHLRIFQNGDDFNEEDFKKYIGKNVTSFYIKKEELGSFVSRFNERIGDVLQPRENVSYEEASKQASDVLDAIGTLVSEFGFTEEVQEITKETVDYSVECMGKEPALSMFLEDFQANRDQYIASHSFATAHMACAIGASLVWLPENTYEKFTYAAFLHDITLDNQELAQIQTIKELEEKQHGFSEQEIQSYLRHTLNASNTIQQFPSLPFDVQAIVAQHHERPDGSGFPEGLKGNQIKQLPAVFIVAHDMVTFLLDHPTQSKLGDFIEFKKEEYQLGPFKKIWESLRDLNEKTAQTA